jgi:hypothetical protein
VVVIFICFVNATIIMPYITGWVLDNNQRPIENATVALPSAGLFALTNEQGHFDIDNVPDGIQRINVVHRNFQKFIADLRVVEDMEFTINMDR